MELRDTYLDRLLSREGLPPDGLGVCGHAGFWRCLSCHGTPLYCTGCCRQAHQAHPLHRVQFWQGTHFEDAWLRHTGVEILCGHGGRGCPEPWVDADGMACGPTASPADAGWGLDGLDDEDEAVQYLVEDDEGEFNNEDEEEDTPDEDESAWLNPLIADLPWVGSSATSNVPPQPGPRASKMMVIVDVSGIHELPVVFCGCPSAPPEDLQLIDLGYYPASNRRPQTAFTFQVLDHFLLTNKECKTSPRNYFNSLRRISNSGLPHMVTVSPCDK